MTNLVLSIEAPASVTMTTGVATPIPGVSVSEPGNVAGETFTVTVNDTTGDLTATGAGVSGVTGSGSGSLSISGSLDQVNTDLAALALTETDSGLDIIAIDASDSLGDLQPVSYIDITANRLVLSITAPASATATLGAASSIPGVSLSEPGSVAGETFTVTLTAGGGLLNAMGAGVSGVTGTGTADLTISGSLDQVNTDLAALTVTETAVGGNHIIVIDAGDSLGDTAGPSLIFVGISAPALSIAAPASAAATLGVSTPIPGISLSEPGSVAGETFTVTLTSGRDLLNATGAGVAGVTGTGTADLTISGSLAQVNADLAALTVTETAVGGNHIIVIDAGDSLGDTAGPSLIFVGISAPVLDIAAPASATVTLGVSTPIPGISLSELGSVAGETFTVTLTSGGDLLNATGAGVAGVTGTGTADLTISGSLAQVNADLAALTVTETAVGGNHIIVIDAGDSLGDTAGPSLIFVTPTPLVLGIAAPLTAAVTTGVSTPIPGISLSEPGNFVGETFTAVLTETPSVLTATGPGVSGSGTADLTITGSLAQVNAALATLSDTESVAGSDTIVVNATDSLGDSAGPVDIAVSALGPVITAPPTLVLTFDQTTAVPGVSLTDTANAANETYTVTISDADGTLSATGANVVGDGTTALTINGSLTDVNAALATLSDLNDSLGPDTIAISATDSIGIPIAPADIAVSTLGPVIVAPSALTVNFIQPTAVPGVSLTDTVNVAGETYSVTLTDSHGVLSATGANVAGDGTTALTINGSLTDVNAALATLSDLTDILGSDTIAIGATDSAGVPVKPADIAVTTALPPLPAEYIDVGDLDLHNEKRTYGSVSSTGLTIHGVSTDFEQATGGPDTTVIASITAKGSDPPSTSSLATITISFEILGPALSEIPVIFSGSVMPSATGAGLATGADFTAGASFGVGTESGSALGEFQISVESDGSGPNASPASKTFNYRDDLTSDTVYSADISAYADGPDPVDQVPPGSPEVNGAAQASVDPTITIDPTFAQASAFTLFTDEIPCFLAGSRILTERGEVPVEALAVDDRVVTLTGCAAADRLDRSGPEVNHARPAFGRDAGAGAPGCVGAGRAAS
jgi:hypothetical protein